MPYLVKGKMRFTDDDIKMSDFTQNVKNNYKNTEKSTLYEMLNQQLVYQELLSDDKEINDKFDTRQNIKISLANSLSMLSAISDKEGYTLDELIGFFIDINN
jgi:hypothetical protein